MKIERGMVDQELMPPLYRGYRREEDILGHVLHALAAHADEVVVVGRVARDVCGNVAGPLEPAGHAVLHLGLERAVDGREPDARMLSAELLVQLLR